MNKQITYSSEAVCRYLKKRGFETIDPSYYIRIQQWEDWYVNGEDEYHKFKVYNGRQITTQTIRSLGMAKTVAETWANLLMNEKVQIGVESEAINDRLQEILQDNCFELNANQLCEKYCAFGTGAFVEYFQDGEIRIDYIHAGMIFPLSWDSRGVHECAFASKKHDKAIGDYIYLQMHVLNAAGNYEIENHCLQIDGNSFKELPLPGDLIDVVDTKSDIPLFQIVKPNIVNNTDLNNPMGISVYANALDVLEEIDFSFDALFVEVKTGRRIILLKDEGFYVGDDGKRHNIIDETDDVFRLIGDSDEQGNGVIHDFSPNFRIADLKNGLQLQLNLLSEKCGMGTNQYEFTNKGVKTATEVISEDSDMYSTLRKHELVLEAALKQLVATLLFMDGKSVDKAGIQINFDDSIIEDKETERKQDQTDLANGTLRKEEYRAKWRNETIEEAAKNLPEQSEVMLE